MSRALRIAVAAMATATAPVRAQDGSMAGMPMPGMAKPSAKPTATKPAAAKQPLAKATERRATAAVTRSPATTVSMQPVDHAAMPGMAADPAVARDEPMAGMAMPAQSDDASMPGMAKTGTALPAGDAAAPAAPAPNYADRFFPAAAMTAARGAMMREQGGQRFAKVMFNLAELQVHDGHTGYRWDGEAWFGGDISRLTLKTEGDGSFRNGVDSAELQALYSRAVGPYFNLQAGICHDFRPSPTRTYATAGFEGLAPYMFEVGGAAFVSEKGDILGRLEGYYDQRLTQRLILQPRVELNFAAQDVPEDRYGAGLVKAEFGLRLRYEIRREVAPYVGVSYEAKTGRSADYARADGKGPTTTSFVAGIHFWL